MLHRQDLYRLTYIQGEQWYKMIINYNNNDRNDNNDNNVKMTSMFILNHIVPLNQQ